MRACDRALPSLLVTALLIGPTSVFRPCLAAGNLDADEFAVAMYLIKQLQQQAAEQQAAAAGGGAPGGAAPSVDYSLPEELPYECVPPSKRSLFKPADS